MRRPRFRQEQTYPALQISLAQMGDLARVCGLQGAGSPDAFNTLLERACESGDANAFRGAPTVAHARV